MNTKTTRTTGLSRKNRAQPLGIAAALLLLLAVGSLAGCQVFAPANPSGAPGLSPTPVEPSPPTGTPFQLFSPESTSPPAVVPEIAPTGPQDFNHYRHPGGFFEADVPADWTAAEEDFSAAFSSPANGSEVLRVQVVHLPYPLDEPALQRFIAAREANRYGDDAEYLQTGSRIDREKGIWTVEKRFSLEGSPGSGVTAYIPASTALLIADAWAEQQRFDAMEDIFSAVLASIRFHPGSAPGLDELAGEHFSYQNELFSMDVPLYWDFQQSRGDETIVDTFSSPDAHALLQVILYDDGEEMSRSAAGEFVLFLLRDLYTKDIEVTSDQVLPGNRERLAWASPSKNYHGTTYFETRGTAVVIVTEMVDDGYEAYQAQTERMINSYIATAGEGE